MQIAEGEKMEGNFLGDALYRRQWSELGEVLRMEYWVPYNAFTEVFVLMEWNNPEWSLSHRASWGS